MNKSLTLPVVILVLLIVTFAAVWMKGERETAVLAVTNFEECAAAGYPIQESFPERCATPDGRMFTRAVATTTPNDSDPGEGTYKSTYKDMIRILSIESGDTIASPVTIKGEARGNWFFEATFPVAIASSDMDGKYIAQGYAQADGEWMTAEYVPFTATITFDPGTEVDGFVVFEKANASGLPKHADAFQIPVKFAKRAGAGTAGGCIISGCSSQICGEEEMVSTCEFRPEYSCYQRSYAKCERQTDGRCGWTQNPELVSCLANPPAIQ